MSIILDAIFRGWVSAVADNVAFSCGLLCPDLHREGHYEMTAGVCLSVCLSIYLSVRCVPRPNSTTKRPRKPKIGTHSSHE